MILTTKEVRQILKEKIAMFASFPVVADENKISEYLTNPKGAIIVSYEGSSFEHNDEYATFIRSKRKLKFAVHVTYRNSIANDEILEELEKLRESVANLVIDSLQRFIVENEVRTLFDEETGIWSYRLDCHVEMEYKLKIN